MSTDLGHALRLRDAIEVHSPAPDLLFAPDGGVAATAIALWRERGGRAPVAARLRGGGALDDPLLARTVAALDRVYAHSQFGMVRLRARFPDAPIETRPAGVPAASRRIAPSTDGVFRIVTCCDVVSSKRLRLLLSALRKCEHAVEWFHVGGGDDRPALERSAESLPPQVSVHFVGRLSHRHWISWLESRALDLFVNVGEAEERSEAIMEALARGLPVLATAAGGTPELLDGGEGAVGVPPEIATAELAGWISRLAAEPPETRARRRNAAVETWRRRADASPLARELAESLAHLARRGGGTGVRANSGV